MSDKIIKTNSQDLYLMHVICISLVVVFLSSCIDKPVHTLFNDFLFIFLFYLIFINKLLYNNSQYFIFPPLPAAFPSGLWIFLTVFLYLFFFFCKIYIYIFYYGNSTHSLNAFS